MTPMVITYYGGLCLKIQSGETVLAFNPPSKESKLKSPRFQTNVVLVNYNSKNYNGWENMSAKIEGKNPVLISGPGEYEVGGVHINGTREGLNTIYTLTVEDIKICHLGSYQGSEVPAEIKGAVGAVDVLFVPIDGESNLSAEDAVKIASKFEPKIMIPLYAFDDEKKNNASIQKFLKEMGEESLKIEEKLTIKKKDIVDKEDEVVYLKACLS